MLQPERFSRFGDWTPWQGLSVSGRLEELRPFYAGDQASNRMDAVRRAINDIRSNWDRYPQFMHELRIFMEADGLDSGDRDDQSAKRLRAIFSSTKEWLEPEMASGNSDYSAIQLYTSEYGYRKMFQTINLAFRSDHLEDDAQALRCATFLVELLTIDLFNSRAANTGADNFEGHVYRGMSVSAEDLEMFGRITRGPIAERYLAIPLPRAPASRQRIKALAFALEECSRKPGRYPLLWDITVSGMSPGLLHVYQERFPESVVTSLCAVPIDRLSDYHDEKEVVLRGPHFQILRLTKRENAEAAAGPIHVIEALMLNSNRDHISAIASNIGQDRRSRDLFRTLITIERSAICAQHAERCGRSADADSYHEMVRKNRAALPALMDAAAALSRSGKAARGQAVPPDR